MGDVYVQVSTGDPPIKVEDAKHHLRVETDADDALLSTYIETAIRAVESYTRRASRPVTWDLFRDEFENPIEIKRDVVTSITEIVHQVNGSDVVVASTVYRLVPGVQSSFIELDIDQIWPTDTDEVSKAIRIRFDTDVKAGWADHLKLGILRIVAYLYEHRGDTKVEGALVVASAADAVLDQMRIVRV